MLKTPLIINGWLVQATLKFLSMESPNLCDYLAPTRDNPPVKSVYRDDRQSLLASYELIISHGEAFAIYSSVFNPAAAQAVPAPDRVGKARWPSGK